MIGLCCVLLVATVVRAAKITVDYNADTDFTKIRTFKFVNTEETSIECNNQPMHGCIIAIIEETQNWAGLQKADDDPDVFVTYHAMTADPSSFTTTGIDYGGWGRGYRRWGGYGVMGTPTTRENTYTNGTLVVDAWNAETETLIWRGTSSQVLKTMPVKQEKQIRKTLTKMAHQCEKTKTSQSKSFGDGP